MNSAVITPSEFPDGSHIATYPNWVLSQLRKQGIQFDDAKLPGPFSILTARQVEDALVPPWEVIEDRVDGTITVKQGAVPAQGLEE